jgi:hypothetical protein
MWDSVSILPGKGDGTFATATSFTVGMGEQFQNTLLTLNTSDLNGDRATDLIVSNGVIMLNRAATSNLPPVASAGDDQTVQNISEVHLWGGGDDPDADMLDFRWFDDTGANRLASGGVQRRLRGRYAHVHDRRRRRPRTSGQRHGDRSIRQHRGAERRRDCADMG